MTALDALLANLRVHPVFTAHPTEARRRAVTSALRRVGDQLERLAELRSPDAPPPETRRRLLEEVDEPLADRPAAQPGAAATR